MLLEQKMNILLVDDRPENLLALEAILHSLGQNLVKAHSGEEALRHLLERDFAVILLDVQMPGIDGFETARLIRQRKKTEHTPIIFITATSPTDSLIFQGYALGAVDYLIKPIAPEILLLKVGVFFELFKKAMEVKKQAEYLKNINEELERQITERKRTEEELQRSKQEIKTLVENVPDVIARYDRQLRHVYINSACEQASGILPQEFIGKTLTEIGFLEEQVILWESCFQRVFATGERQSMEYNYLGIKGMKYYQTSVVPEFSNDGSVEFIISITRDITPRQQTEEALQKANEQLEIKVQERTTELILNNQALQAEIESRQQAEDALQESEQRFRGIFNQAAVGIAQLGIDGQWLLVNQKVCDIVGYTKAELLELSFQDITHPDDLETDLEYVRQLLADEIDTYSMEKRYIRKDGSLVWINLTVSLVRDFLGEPKYLISIIKDISERKQAEEELRISEQRYRSLVTATAQIVWTTNAEGEVIDDMPTWRNLTGQTLEEFKGWGWLNAIHPDDRESINRLWIKALKAKSFYQTEYQLRMKDGSYRDFLVRGVPVLGADDNIREWVGICTDITDHKQAEKTLKENEAQMRLALEAADMGTWNLNLVTGSVRESERIGPMFGLPSGQVNYNLDDWRSRVHPDDLERILAEMGQAIAGVAQYDTRYRAVWDDGTIRWLAVKGKILRDQAGNPLYAVGVAMDITERKQAEEERERLLVETGQLASLLEQERSQLEAIIQQMPAGIVIAKAPSGKIILGNQQVEQIWRQPFIPSADIAQYKEWKGFHPDGRPYEPLDWPLARSITTGELVTQEEISILRGDGTLGVILVNSTPIRDRQGKIIAGVVMFNDITERKQAQEELQKSYNLLEGVIEGTIDAIFVKDLQGRYVLLNSTSAKIIGGTKEEIIGKDDRDFFPPEIAHILMETDQRIMTTGESQILEESVPIMETIAQENPPCTTLKEEKKVGEIIMMRTFLSAKSVWRDAQENIIGLIGVGKDITDRKKAEQEIINLNENLERRVLERTAELEATNKELEAFSYSVSHDLRAPLRGIDGFSQALVDRYADKLDDKGQHYIQRIRAGTQRMGELIDDLLTLSRMTRSEMRRRQVDLSALAKEILAELSHAQPEREAEWAIAPGLIANGDPQLLRVVLENLLNNAWKFSSAKLHSRIEFDAILQEEGKVAYFVRDNGAGFDMAYSNKLFGAFQRLHSTTQFPGTGIGLATVARIIHRHGGRVWAEGVVEEGATFYFTL